MLRQKHGAVVLLLLWAEAAAALRSLRYRDMAWLGLGGGGLLIYAVAAIVGRFHVAAPLLRHDPLRAAAVAAIIALLVGLLSGLAVARLALSRALRAFLLVQPVRFQALIHSAAVATAMLGVTLALASGFIVALAAGSAGVLLASLVSVAWTLAFAAGFAVGAALRISGARAETDRWSARNPTSAGLHLRPLATLDAAAPRWLGSWSWGLAPGQLRLSAVQALLLAIILIASAFAAATGLVQHEVLPASFAAVIGGLLIFMLSLSCRPLGSPVLRTAPLGFAKAWLRLLLLPLLLSLTFFVLPAGAAVAAEPGNWAVPAQAGLGLLLLNGLYAVFAACFLQSPLVASLSFLGGLGYFSWQSVDLGRTVYFGLAVLIGWLCTAPAGDIAMASDAPVLEITGLAAGYRGRAVIEAVDLVVQRGEILGLLGANGSGKSTLLKAVTGLLSPMAGRVAIDGVDLARAPERAKAGFGFAVDPADLPEPLSGRQYLELVASLRGCTPDDAHVAKAAQRLGLEPWLAEPIADYSLGTRAKLSIVATLVGAPPLLILDESLNGLDPVAAWEVKEMLRALAGSGRHAVIVSTHVVETIPTLCAGAVLLANGHLDARWDRAALEAASGTPGEFEAQVMATLRASLPPQEGRLTA